MTNRMRGRTGRLWPHERGSSSWSSRIVATVVTLGAFVAAFIAMATVRGLRLTEQRSHDAVAVVRLTPPNERVEPPKPPIPTRIRAQTPRAVSPVIPTRKSTTDSVRGAPPR